jgi:hypothetical protein
MQKSLQESLKYTPFLTTETLLNWVEYFGNFSSAQGHHLDTYSLINSAEWQELVDQLQGIESVFYVR